MGIGSCSLKDSTLVKCGYISKADYEQFKQHGAVGDVLLKFLDKTETVNPSMNSMTGSWGYPMRDL